MLDKITKGKQSKPRRTVIYGVHGVGKSTWAAAWPSPVFVCTEDGVNDLDVARFPLCITFMNAMEAVMSLSSGQHEYKTLVIDSADWLERLAHQAVCEDEHNAKVKCIADINYGKGYAQAARRIEGFLKLLDSCRSIGMHVVVIAHAAIVRFTNPEGESYDRYTPALHKDASALLQQWADEVLFATYEVFTRTAEERFGQKRALPVGSGNRILKTSERPTHDAKNRIGLPEQMSMDIREYANYIKKGVSNG